MISMLIPVMKTADDAAHHLSALQTSRESRESQIVAFILANEENHVLSEGEVDIEDREGTSMAEILSRGTASQMLRSHSRLLLPSLRPNRILTTTDHHTQIGALNNHSLAHIQVSASNRVLSVLTFDLNQYPPQEVINNIRVPMAHKLPKSRPMFHRRMCTHQCMLES
jgi:hypothetical protein